MGYQEYAVRVNKKNINDVFKHISKALPTGNKVLNIKAVLKRDVTLNDGKELKNGEEYLIVTGDRHEISHAIEKTSKEYYSVDDVIRYAGESMDRIGYSKVFDEMKI